MQIGGHEVDGVVVVAIVSAVSAAGGWVLKRLLTRPDERVDALIRQQTGFAANQAAFNTALQAEVRACHERHHECEKRCDELAARLRRVEREALGDPPEDSAD